jgi:Trypsin
MLLLLWISFSSGQKRLTGNFFEQVLVGSFVDGSTSNGKAQWRNIISGTMRVHPDYHGQPNPQSDVMLFQIEPVTLSHIKPVALNNEPTNPVGNQTLVAIGYGSLDSDVSQFPGHLQKVLVRAVEYDACKTDYLDFLTKKKYVMNESTMLCAAAPSKDTCQGMY